MRKYVLIPLVSIGLAAAGLLSASAVSAAPGGTVSAVVHASGHPDTCACANPTGVTSANGPVWAYDNIARQFTAVPGSGDHYTVTITDDGSFAAFADPISGLPFAAHGSIRGTYSLDVQSTLPPLASALPPTDDGDVSTPAMIMQLFQGGVTSIVGGAYAYTYRAGGCTMVQDTSGVTGDVC
jgi:hypothetical protein